MTIIHDNKPKRLALLTDDQLSPDQRETLRLVSSGANVFVSGEPGTGKSTLVERIKHDLTADNRNYAVVAPTGIAALNVGGMTIHRLFKFPIKPMTVPIARACGQRDQVRPIVNALDTLIIDEISMVRADLFAAIDMAMRAANDTKEPFGGVQLIVVGDFSQLPPVVEDDRLKDWLVRNFGGVSAQNSKPWQGANIVESNLTTVHRQVNDPTFVEGLRRVRNHEHDAVEYLNNLLKVSAKPPEDATIIALTNAVCNEINETKLKQLQGCPVEHQAQLENVRPNESPAPVKLTIKQGARVMLLANDPDGRFVNGDMAEVIEPAKQINGRTVVRVRLDRGETIDVHRHEWQKASYYVSGDEIRTSSDGVVRQYPMKLAWAITAHKSQGQTLDRVHLTLEREAFATGQLYVALSRVRSADTLTLGRPLTERDLIVGRRA